MLVSNKPPKFINRKHSQNLCVFVRFNGLQQPQNRYWCLHKRRHLLSSASHVEFLCVCFPGAAVRGEIEEGQEEKIVIIFLGFDHL